MGKGISKRRREKRLERANDGNLHKAALGKRGASASLKLPQGPPTDKELTDKMPASLRKLLSLQEAANKQDRLKAERKAAMRNKGAGTEVDEQKQGSRQDAPTAGGDRKQGIQNKQSKQTPTGKGKAQTQELSDNKQQGKGGGASSGQGPAQDSKPGPSKPVEKIYVSSAFEQPVKKGLKEKKKAYLNRRKEMKKKGKRGKAGEENMSAVELKLKAQHATTSGKFGEVADAPLQVHLKRKHWVKGEGGQADGEGAAGGATGERMKKIFLKQMEAASQQAAAASTRSAGPAKKKAKTGAATAAGGKAGTQQQQAPVGLLQKAKMLQEAAKKKAETEALREQVIAAYRAQKHGGAGSAGASMTSLAKLVKRGDAAARASVLS